MAFRAPASFCADTAIARFLPLKGFTPAKSFCSNLAVHQRSIEVATNLNSRNSTANVGIRHLQQSVPCSAGSTHCSLLNEIQAADKTLARNVCRCIGVYILVPGITSSVQPTIESPSSPTPEHQTGATTIRPISREIDKPTMSSLPKITLGIETTETGSITSDVTTISEWSTSTPIFASLHISASISDEMSDGSDVGIETSTSASSSSSILASTNSCMATDSLSSSSDCPASSFSHPSSFLSLPNQSSYISTDSINSSSASSGSLSSPNSSPYISTGSVSSSSDYPALSLSQSSSSSSSTLSSSSICSLSDLSSCSSTGSFSSTSTSSTSSSIPSSATASICPTCTYPTATTSCPTVTATGLAYQQYYAGQCFVENTVNPGNSFQPAIYTRFRGVYDLCAVTQYCANSAAAAYGQFHSFDLHYICTNSSWMCVQYYYRNSDVSYFDVPNSDVAVGVGYSY